ncbi:glutamate synthase subunit beta [Rubellicoccus peritrichatus]|uniref:Glutamate synthase subunit beta n=1 Tax=Rubellicoccus peritrichatus TaxID=3080537 RepID=A0AAQ3LBF5_9BACT|nr:glutamate synthase subunit beta [Puniceicoccus sp. CR14]WOO42207.1 glutamate synthase subunit beta [Puniceicoccus sp. CR14]
MGKPTGFLEVERKTVAESDPLERIKNWDEFKEHPPAEQLQKQGSRCMDCGTPFCHTGMTISGMASGCPINNLIPEWNDLVYKGRWEEALERLHKTNNFPEFTGRVCPAPCEGSCVLGVIEPPVTIKNIEASIIDRGWAEGWVKPNPPETRTGKKVAIVGSGPAGLACADQLNQAGHEVTVYERADRIGGLLMYGIPNMKLEKEDVVQRRVDLMEAEGIKFVTGVEIGKAIPAKQLMDEFDAVVLATGATKPNDFLAKAENRDAKGIHFAMEFLTKNTSHILDTKMDGSIPELNAKGKDVVVIGGGDTGTDCVGTSVRHGATSVVQLEIMPQPPMERAANNPWPEWPKVYKLDYGQEEAKAKWGDDPRQYLINTKRFIKDEDGNLSGIEIVNISWERGDDGRMKMIEDKDSIRVLPCQLALFAMGFSGPEQVIAEEIGLETDARSNYKAEHEKYTTSIPGVFASGDCRRGQSLVVWAINEGRGAARECDRYLMGVTTLP